MARPKGSTNRTREEEWYDIFAAWDPEDQAKALQVLEAVHGVQKRAAARQRTPDRPEAATTSAGPIYRTCEDPKYDPLRRDIADQAALSLEGDR